jgi:hypothetical protein
MPTGDLTRPPTTPDEGPLAPHVELFVSGVEHAQVIADFTGGDNDRGEYLCLALRLGGTIDVVLAARTYDGLARFRDLVTTAIRPHHYTTDT